MAEAWMVRKFAGIETEPLPGLVDTAPAQVATEVATDPWADHRNDLSRVASEIEDLRDQLGYLLEERAELVEQAAADGMPQREIGWELDISHTAVQKILAGQDPLRALRAVISDV